MPSTAHSVARRGAVALTEAILIVLVAIALTVALAVATRGAPAGAAGVHAATATSSWIELSSVAGRSAASIQPTLGDSVSFATSYPKTVKNPRILVNCYQDNALVFGMGGSVSYDFQLGGAGSIWLTNGGSADCEALLYYYGSHAGKQTFNVLARTTFSAGG
jgi:hypothetical protein